MMSSDRSSPKYSMSVVPLSPIVFLTDVPEGQHLALFYENEYYGEILKLWYLVHGLIKGEHAVYTTHGEVEKARAMMLDRGVDVDYYERERKLLHILKSDDVTSDSKFYEAMRESYDKIFSKTGFPCRIVRSTISDLTNKENMKTSLRVESCTMDSFEGKAGNDSPFSIFSKFRGSVMCSYSIVNCDHRDTSLSKWMNENEMCHHSTILITSDKKMVIKKRTETA